MLEKPCPHVIDLMTCKSDYSLVTLSNNEMGIRKTINTSTSRSLIEIMGDPIVVEEARNLVNYCLKLFREIHDHCPFPRLEARIEGRFVEQPSESPNQEVEQGFFRFLLPYYTPHSL